MSHELFNTVCAKHLEISDNKKKDSYVHASLKCKNKMRIYLRYLTCILNDRT